MSGRVLYASFATPHLSGGVDVHLRHIALLRAAGVEASLWLPAPEVPAWMGEVPVVSGPTLEVGADDVVLYPEAPVVPGVDPAPGARKAVFNQNHFYTYATWDAPASAYPGWDPAPSVWTVSRESVAVISALHPDLAVHRVPPPVDPDLFGPAEVQRGVALLPKKRPHEGRLLERLLEVDPRTSGEPVRVIADLTRAEVVRTLAESRVFVSLSHTDSFGLPVVEAMLSGCLVVGYDGGGGVELFEAPGAWRVPEQRPLLVVDQVAEVLARGDPDDLGAANRAWALERYSPAAVAPALADALAAVRRTPGAATTAVHPSRWLDAMPVGFTKTG
ncbi:Glycosyl transferases group 1 [Microlunatus sagamiharensis]|uniref:Glycosyl transferases group 1 n=1 Tax=Microlunatus sagamiharensis TaxID=546874 RepID=A0A1H2LTI7_9ACTN|nr:glycosyltransferase [Microlunatus sagamiharensis]SDU84008.1 Glycosyl transferases group 1 [Microlunatus sagamiharensis]